MLKSPLLNYCAGRTMHLKKLQRFLYDIDNRTPIQFAKFIRLIKSFDLGIPVHSHDIQAIKAYQQHYTVTAIPPGLYKALKVLASSDLSQRATAAQQNKSHQVNVAGSFLIVRKMLDYPQVIIFDTEGNFSRPINFANTVLIIENRQNFLQIDKTISFLHAKTAFKHPAEYDVVFAEGNGINNSLHREFLSCYTHIYLFLDLDLGGLRIADNLMSTLSDATFDFLLPDDIKQRLDYVQEMQDIRYLDKVTAIGKNNALLARCAALISNTGKILEQEAYLNEFA